MSEKLQKILARAGLGSRREMEQWLAGGRVSVNGQIAKLGDRAEATDQIRVDGQFLKQKPVEEIQKRVIAYHKPEGEICTRRDPEQRPSVFERLPRLHQGRWIAVGRLDINTTGLMLFTNDGDLANKLMHPSTEVLRDYAVRVLGEVDDKMLQRLQKGVMLEDGEAKFEKVKFVGGEGANQWYRASLREGRKREVRRLWESQEVTVSRLTRVAYGPIELPKSLARGRWMDLTKEDMVALYKIAGLPIPDFKTYAEQKRTQRKAAHTKGSKPSFKRTSASKSTGSRSADQRDAGSAEYSGRGKPRANKSAQGKSAQGKPVRGTASRQGRGEGRSAESGSSSAKKQPPGLYRKK